MLDTGYNVPAGSERTKIIDDIMSSLPGKAGLKNLFSELVVVEPDCDGKYIRDTRWHVDGLGRMPVDQSCTYELAILTSNGSTRMAACDIALPDGKPRLVPPFNTALDISRLVTSTLSGIDPDWVNKAAKDTGNREIFEVESDDIGRISISNAEMRMSKPWHIQVGAMHNFLHAGATHGYSEPRVHMRVFRKRPLNIPDLAEGYAV